MKKSIMQNTLGKQWQDLPEALKNHYRSNDKGENHSQGHLDINYPWFMQWPLSLMRLMGGLPNRRGKGLKTTVSTTMKEDKQYWHRVIHFPDGSQIKFKSLFIVDGEGFIEYVNTFLGLKMVANVKGNILYYESRGYVLKIRKLKIPIPEWLALGHASIVESENRADENQVFNMDFKIVHPLFGQLFSYKGQFKTKTYDLSL